MGEFRTGVRLGVDVGKARIGVARCDPLGTLATPVETVARDAAGSADVLRIVAIANEQNAIEIVVGLPLSLSGSNTASTDDAVAFAQRLAGAAGRPVRLVDERLSTVTAHSALRDTGRSQKRSRKIIDQVAAVIILQHAIDTEKSTSEPPGTWVETTPES
ncbi:Holliday junction resolvase RuvX [Paramicrobacterium chengjingii]|uniref:Putative pre-16S rRNA nuclease n=1 Tax=Paramicrobacterium chengjingii TaxID=2769067 RepID=A0ABX6YMP9_9MICO|nr:Holliday junction resolvase RuvX [Microbacterium chengjingii]QPZ40002.1 Holliday junction resolvase RuvX [Microbacterium chengjingii]